MSRLKDLETKTGISIDSIPVDGIPYHMISEDGFYRDIPVLCDSFDDQKNFMFVSFYDIVTAVGLSRNNLWDINSRWILDAGLGREYVMANREDINDVLSYHWVRDRQYIMEKVGSDEYSDVLDKYIGDMRKSKTPENVIEVFKEIKFLYPRAHDVELAFVVFKFIWYKMNYPDMYEA